MQEGRRGDKQIPQPLGQGMEEPLLPLIQHLLQMPGLGPLVHLMFFTNQGKSNFVRDSKWRMGPGAIDQVLT